MNHVFRRSAFMALLLAVSAPAAFAAANTTKYSSLATDQGQLLSAKFYTPAHKAEIPSVERLDQATRATFRLEQGEDQIKCTGTFVSPYGHVITALHCVKDCLRAAGAFKASQISEDYLDDVDATKLPVTCNVKIINTQETRDVALQIIATGPGFMRSPTDSMLENRVMFLQEDLNGYINAFKAGYPGVTSRLDYAIGIVKSDPVVAASCLPVSFDRTMLFTPVWRVSWPIASARGDGYDADGTRPYWSFGSVITLAQSNQAFLQDYAKDAKAFIAKLAKKYKVSPDVMDYAFRLYKDKEIILTDVDEHGGSSGAALLDYSGRMIGLLSAGIGDTESTVPTNLEVSLNAVKNDLVNRLKLDDVAIQEIFSCSQ